MTAREVRRELVTIPPPPPLLAGARRRNAALALAELLSRRGLERPCEALVACGREA
jgi:hypothetical protein